MTRLFFLILIFPLISSAQVMETSGKQKSNHRDIQWAEDLTWDQLKVKAKAENKLIFVDAYATWCAPCKLMDKNVYPNDTVAQALNLQFISVKIQMDETPKDNEFVRAWYTDARLIKSQNKIDGYPSFLFFSPEGRLMHQDLGLKSPAQFIALVKEALTDPIGQYEGLIEKYKNGQIEEKDLSVLAMKVLTKKDKELAKEIGRSYKEKYLDRLKNEEVFTKDNLLFLSVFYYNLLNSKDRYFQFFYQQEDHADRLAAKKISKNIVSAIIAKEEIRDKIYIGKKAIAKPKPAWNKFKSKIAAKYGDDWSKQFFPDEQIAFYQAAQDWKNYSSLSLAIYFI
jgi:thioredoxin-related protein